MQTCRKAHRYGNKHIWVKLKTNPCFPLIYLHTSGCGFWKVDSYQTCACPLMLSVVIWLKIVSSCVSYMQRQMNPAAWSHTAKFTHPVHYLWMGIGSSEIYLHLRVSFANLCSKIIYRKSKLGKIEYFSWSQWGNLTYCRRIQWLLKCFTTEKIIDMSCMHMTTCIHYLHQNEKIKTWNGKLLSMPFDKKGSLEKTGPWLLKKKICHIDITFSGAVGNKAVMQNYNLQERLLMSHWRNYTYCVYMEVR